MAKTNTPEQDNRKRRKSPVLTWMLLVTGAALIIGVITTAIADTGAFAQYLGKADKFRPYTEALFMSCVGLLCLVLGLERKLDISGIEDSISEQKNALLAQNSHFDESKEQLAEISKTMINIHELTLKINLQTELIGQMRKVRDQYFDPLLNKIFKDYIDNSIEFFSNAIAHKKITFSEHDRFEKAYAKCLEHLQPCHFLATASTSKNYFWTAEGEENSTIENAIAKFTSSTNGTCKMTRIFFIDPEELNETYTIGVLNKQLTIGVEVFTIAKRYVSAENLRYFVVDDKKRICWQAFTDQDKNIQEFTYSSNEHDTEKFFNIFETLVANNQIKKYKRS